MFALFRRQKTRQKKRSRIASNFGWALLFLTSGRMPPPPPQSQIEQDIKARNNRSEKSGSTTDPDP